MNPRLQRAISRFDLGAYVHQTFDPVIEASSGTELRINCFAPKGCGSSDTNQHLWINAEKKVWICYKCGYGSAHEQPGSTWLPQFIADAEGKSLPAVKKWLVSQVEPTPVEGLGELLSGLLQNQSPVVEKQGEIVLPELFQRFSFTATGTWAQPFIKYAKKRGITDSQLLAFDVRCCFSSASRWKGRLIFPIWDLDGKVRSATGRAVSDREPRWTVWPKSDIQQMLWPLGAWGADGSWLSLRHVARGLHLTLVEGVLDALASHIGLNGPALATFGKKLSDQQLAVLQELAPSEITLAWDYDARSKMVQTVKRLQGRFDRVSVIPFVSPYWKEHDLGDLLMMDRKEASDILKSEMTNRVQVDSSEFLAWATRMGLS